MIIMIDDDNDCYNDIDIVIDNNFDNDNNKIGRAAYICKAALVHVFAQK